VKVLMIGNIESIFLYEYITEILCSQPNLQITVLSGSHEGQLLPQWKRVLDEQHVNVIYQPKISVKLGKRIHPLVLFRNFTRYTICEKFDVIHLYGVSKLSFAVAWFAKANANILVSYYGSELLRSDERSLHLQEILLRRADHITIATEYLRKRFTEIYQGRYLQKLQKLGYGTKNADIMQQALSCSGKADCKKENGLPMDRLCIFCGYNGNPAQRHLEIIRELSTLPEEIRRKIHLVFHCAYALTETYREKLERCLAESGLPGTILTEFKTGAPLARLRMCTDIMLNLQSTDAISASMLECLEAGAVVIKGDWLVYPELEARNTYLLSIFSMNQLASTITDVVERFSYYQQQTKLNRGILRELLSWSAKRDDWLQMIRNKRCDLK